MKMRIFYDAGAAEGGTATTPVQPSMSELRAAVAAKGSLPTPPVVVATPAPITGGDGKPVIPDAAAIEAQQKLEAENTAKGLNPDGSPKTATPVVVMTPEQILADKMAAEGKNPDGTPLTPEPELTDDEQIALFFKTVDDKSGKPVKVEYPVGVDPLSPDGVYLRDQALREQAQLEFQQAIREGNPRGYAYMLHLENGGTDDEFLGKGVGLALPDRALVETDAAAQTMLYKMDLKAKGLDDDTITAIVEKSIKDNKLKEKSLLSYDGIVKDQKDQLLLIEQREQQALAQDRAIGTAFNASVDKTMSTMRLVVPDVDKPGFKQFLNENVRIDNGQIYLVQPINGDNLQQTMEAMLLMFKNGDLSKIVQKQAATQTAQRLRTSLDATKVKTPGSTPEQKKLTTSVPLSEIWKKRRELQASGQQ